uniref:Uncharacterized protein n=1 Tax=viral metagenome TaxID=1070528 RepID=A0A6C0FAR7_9ZZZZ
MCVLNEKSVKVQRCIFMRAFYTRINIKRKIKML